MSESIIHERMSTLFDMGFTIYAIAPDTIKVDRHNYAVPFHRVHQIIFYTDSSVALTENALWLLECIAEQLDKTDTWVKDPVEPVAKPDPLPPMSDHEWQAERLAQIVEAMAASSIPPIPLRSLAPRLYVMDEAGCVSRHPMLCRCGDCLTYLAGE